MDVGATAFTGQAFWSSSEEAAIRYIQVLNHHTPRLTLIDMDLILPAGVTAEAAHGYLTCLRSHIRQGDGVFACCLGAIWTNAWDEDGAQYLKVLFVFDGTALRYGGGRGEWISMYWRVVITEGKGTCHDFDCWYQLAEGVDEEVARGLANRSGSEVYYRLIKRMGEVGEVLQVIGVPKAGA
ncbi:hypothetical protein ACFPAG_16575 [Vogesella sp. GCM10023246]|uniref:Uncharacterized protein n=1 Tax=Vogesella oryzagri TaxID=3160864 RepID=A0ABV1M891_9NEIS